jgi:hypothetical protein
MKCKKKRHIIQTNNHITEAQNQIIYTLNSTSIRQNSILSFNSALRNSNIVKQETVENLLPTYEEYIFKEQITYF